MSQKTISETEYKQIIQEACHKPFGDVISMGAPPPTEKDYLYAVWRGLASHIEWGMPMLKPANGRTDVELLRDEIHELVTGHQSTNYPIQPTLSENIDAALAKPLA